MSERLAEKIVAILDTADQDRPILEKMAKHRGVSVNLLIAETLANRFREWMHVYREHVSPDELQPSR